MVAPSTRRNVLPNGSDSLTGHTRWESGQLAWYFRHYAWLVLICVLALAGLPLVLGAAAPTYQADAIVVARQLAVRADVLPLLGENVFNSGAVEERVAADPSVSDTEGLIPGRLSVVVPRDSIVMTVQARDENPETAARLANLGAAALADELNIPGAGVGQFAVQAAAVPPTEPLQSTSPALLVTAGALAGLMVGLGLAALLVVLRRPVLDDRDVGDAVGVPLLGLVEVPVGDRGSYSGPAGVRGIATVTRWMAGLPAGRVILTSPASMVSVRQRLYVMLGVALALVRDTRLRADPELVEAVDRLRPRLAAAPTDERNPRRRPGSELVLVDGGSPTEMLSPGDLSVVVVALRGTTRRRLRAVADDHRDAGLVGVVLVDTRRGARRAPAAPSRSVPADHDAAGAEQPTVSESERT